jgi:YD repeat-containing protein
LACDENGNQVTVVVAGGETTYYAYDELDRLASVRADLPVRGRTQTGALGVDATTYYLYDEVGNRTRLDDAESHATPDAVSRRKRFTTDDTDGHG